MAAKEYSPGMYLVGTVCAVFVFIMGLVVCASSVFLGVLICLFSGLAAFVQYYNYRRTSGTLKRHRIGEDQGLDTGRIVVFTLINLLVIGGITAFLFCGHEVLAFVLICIYAFVSAYPSIGGSIFTRICYVAGILCFAYGSFTSCGKSTNDHHNSKIPEMQDSWFKYDKTYLDTYDGISYTKIYSFMVLGLILMAIPVEIAILTSRKKEDEVRPTASPYDSPDYSRYSVPGSSAYSNNNTRNRASGVYPGNTGVSSAAASGVSSAAASTARPSASPSRLSQPTASPTAPAATQKQKDNKLLKDAAYYVVEHQSASTSMLQRNFSIGYHKAGEIMDKLEALGIVGPQIGSMPRRVLVQDPTTLDLLFLTLDLPKEQ